MTNVSENGDSNRPEILINSFDEKSVSQYIRKLDEISLIFDTTQPIVVDIDSFGGSLYGMSKLYEYLISMPNPIITYTSSKAMSAGAIMLSTVGSRGMRIASPNASIMIHEIQSHCWGDIKDMENNVEFTKKENDKWMTLLAKSMGLKSAKDVRTILMKNKGRELYLNAKQAKKLGLIDKISYIKMIPIQRWEIIAIDESKTEFQGGEHVKEELPKPKKRKKRKSSRKLKKKDNSD